MPRKPRYKMLESGAIVDTKLGFTIGVKEFTVERSGRLEVVRIIDNAGKKIKIARYAIDETAFNLGEAVPADKAGKKRRPKAKTSATHPPDKPRPGIPEAGQVKESVAIPKVAHLKIEEYAVLSMISSLGLIRETLIASVAAKISRESEE